MKKSRIIISVILIMLGFLIGKYFYSMIEKDKNHDISEKNIIAKENQTIGEKTLVNSSETKITPNTKIIEKIYYKGCSHINTKETIASIDEINLNEEELKKKFPEYEIQKFTPQEVIIYKEETGICDEHYLLKDNNGYIGIYALDKTEKKGDLIELTEIATDFLPDEDRQKIMKGMKIYTRSELNKIIEDFE